MHDTMENGLLSCLKRSGKWLRLSASQEDTEAAIMLFDSASTMEKKIYFHLILIKKEVLSISTQKSFQRQHRIKSIRRRLEPGLKKLIPMRNIQRVKRTLFG